MRTFFAPAERDSQDKVVKDYGMFRTFENLSDIVNGLPYIALILNKHRQLVFTNNYLVELLGAKDVKELLGLRPGELINCVHATENEGGCGTSESCRYCGAVNAIMECLRTGQRAQGECRITARQPDSTEISHDFFVSASPFSYKGEDYVILSFNDISNEKRRKLLEKIFFHDILNTAGGLRGFLEFLKTFPDSDDRDELLQIAMKLSNQMIDEITAQRELLAAEQGELVPHVETLNCHEILNETHRQIAHHPVASDKNIRIDTTDLQLKIITDPLLLRRVLLNMVKNALEASNEGQTVTLSYTPDFEQKTITFCVHNVGEMSPEVKAQIFQRSFSTKSSSRGVGTYSIKLLGEKYLKGKVSFTSTAAEGTTFRIALPMAP
ncbi:MAG: HAMP domain-containing histidine kinase [Bacteroidetes bacterium]|nr:HAMP domain-containing histidine kinase [Bacteroidota bacterium]